MEDELEERFELEEEKNELDELELVVVSLVDVVVTEDDVSVAAVDEDELWVLVGLHDCHPR